MDIDMESSDIRDRYDFDGKDMHIATARLDTYPPLWKGSKTSSGIDCLIVVIRRIYSCYVIDTDFKDAVHWVAMAEKQNPILRHAWHVFGNSPDNVARTTEDRKSLEKVLNSLGITPQASFKDICGSSMMNKTFWSHDWFRLSHPPFDTATGKPIDLSPDEIAKLSTLELDLCKSPDDRLQEVVDKAFGIRTLGGVEVGLIPSAPWVVRVLYRVPKMDRIPTIQHLKTMEVPIWTKCLDRSDLCFRESGRNLYYLMAVVRMRRDGRSDLVRTYNPTGSNVLFNYTSKYIMSDQWSVVEGDRTYMLFYASMPMNLCRREIRDRTYFPEVAQREDVDEEWMEAFEELMRKTKSTLSTTVPKPKETIPGQATLPFAPLTSQPPEAPSSMSRDSSVVAKRQRTTVQTEDDIQSQDPKRQREEQGNNELGTIRNGSNRSHGRSRLSGRSHNDHGGWNSSYRGSRNRSRGGNYSARGDSSNRGRSQVDPSADERHRLARRG
ncbi:hypothetical protein FPSE_03922 [Fusarium pseudograminearum CS3096]|uniref:Uncharacterized protein n=2 Tax=Fusarium pseudograminearum TaxID=101028 RepID=K3VLE0_FUSPC|nr:hypothetical protein FPSE_03922 [Fusarium pseudograminearum CS3096]EKJ75742.1 hypothetical protein FPSE_03922 [Fusarium pseudograminearum CS3096]CEG02887.1 unnamed protein product [Fusarium pseudograminearum CS3487]